MVRHSRERPSAELELLMKPREEQNSLEKSVQILRSDLKSEQLVEQYEVSLMRLGIDVRIFKNTFTLGTPATKGWLYIRNKH